MFFDIIKSIYTKSPIQDDIDTQTNITLNSWLLRDKENIFVLNRILPFLFYIHPEHYFYLLFFNIRKAYKTPFLPKLEKATPKKEDKLFQKAREIMNWSSREAAYAEPFLMREFEKDEKYWKGELGV